MRKFLIKFNKQSQRKAFSLLFFLGGYLFHTTAYSMDIIRAKQNARQADAFVNSFPSMTFNQARAAWNNVSDAHQQRIELADKKRNKDKENLIFNIVRYFPLEVCENILLLFFSNNKTAADEFLKIPIHQAFEQYSYSKEMVEKSQYWHPGLDLRTIPLAEAFMMTEQLQVVSRALSSNKNFLQRKELEAFRIMGSKSSLNMPMLATRLFKYRFYRKFTVDSLVAGAVPGLLIASIVDFPLALLWLSRVIELYGCEQKVALESVVQLNTLIEKTRTLILESGHDELLKSLLPLENSMAYALTDHVKIAVPLLLPIPLISLRFFIDARYEGMDFFQCLKYSAVRGLFFGSAFAIVLFLLSYIPFEEFPGGFLGFGVYINATIVAATIGFRYGAVHHWQKADVRFDRISDCLQDSTIVLENCFE